MVANREHLTALHGRGAECAALAGFVEVVRHGSSAVLVIRGEPGAGKTALVDYAVALAADLRVVRAAGMESETELAYGGLHQLCRPMHACSAACPGRSMRRLRSCSARGPGQARIASW